MALPQGSVTQAAGLDIAINKKGESFYVKRGDVNKAILNLPNIMRDIKIMPHLNKGMPQGIRLASVKDDSIFEKAGVTSGDVIKSINGMLLNTPYQIFNAYKKLRNEKNFKVDIVRDKKDVVLNYVIE